MTKGGSAFIPGLKTGVFSLRPLHPHEIKPETPTHMYLLILRALNEKKITRSWARELFGGDMPEITAGQGDR